MVKYQIYQGRPCGTTARGDARWLRSALEKEALRRGISAIGTLDQICTRLISYYSSISSIFNDLEKLNRLKEL